jgi:hypothetical protein
VTPEDGGGGNGSGPAPSSNGVGPEGRNGAGGDNHFARARRPLAPEDMTCFGCAAFAVLIALSIAFWLFIYWRNADEFRVSRVTPQERSTPPWR